MSRNPKKQPEVEPKAGLTQLHKWGIAAVISVLIAVGLCSMQTAQAEESITAAPVVETDGDMPEVEALPPEEPNEDSFRDRWGRAYDYLFSGDTSEILETKAAELKAVEAELQSEQQRIDEQAQWLTEQIDKLNADQQAILNDAAMVEAQQQLFAERLASLSQCVTSAMSASSD